MPLTLGSLAVGLTQHVPIEREVGDEPLQKPIPGLWLPWGTQIAYAQMRRLPLPLGNVASPTPTCRHVRDRRAAFDLAQRIDDLLFRELRLLHLRFLPPKRLCPEMLPRSSSDCSRFPRGPQRQETFLPRKQIFVVLYCTFSIRELTSSCRASRGTARLYLNSIQERDDATQALADCHVVDHSGVPLAHFAFGGRGALRAKRVRAAEQLWNVLLRGVQLVLRLPSGHARLQGERNRVAPGTVGPSRLSLSALVGWWYPPPLYHARVRSRTLARNRWRFCSCAGPCVP